MARSQERKPKPITGLRITEEPGLYGLVIRERGELIEYVSYHEAARRHDLAGRKQASVAAAIATG